MWLHSDVAAHSPLVGALTCLLHTQHSRPGIPSALDLALVLPHYTWRWYCLIADASRGVGEDAPHREAHPQEPAQGEPLRRGSFGWVRCVRLTRAHPQEPAQGEQLRRGAFVWIPCGIAAGALWLRNTPSCDLMACLHLCAPPTAHTPKACCLVPSFAAHAGGPDWIPQQGRQGRRGRRHHQRAGGGRAEAAAQVPEMGASSRLPIGLLASDVHTGLCRRRMHVGHLRWFNWYAGWLSPKPWLLALPP